LLLSILFFSTIKSQNEISVDSIVYARAYNYITTDSLFVEKVVNVSNKLTGTCYSCFYNEIKGYNDLEAYYSYYTLDRKYALIDSVHTQFDVQFAKHENVEIVINFSAIVNNELFANVDMSKFTNTHFGETVFYYFRFDSEGNIELVYKKKMHGL